MRGKRILAYFLVLAIFVPGKTLFSAVEIDHGLFTELLKEFVSDGSVDYNGFNNNEKRLDRYLEMLAGIKIASLPHDDRFAFFINAYNAWTIKLILDRYPDVKSIKDLGNIFKSPWQKRICNIDGELITLDNIEHDIIRSEFQDPRAHFALNCASKGCPPLRSEAYTGSNLESQLNDVTASFINDPKRYRFEDDTLYISSIFKWFKRDFNGDIVGFFLKFAKGNLKSQILEKRDQLKVKYLEYDWSLNGK